MASDGESHRQAQASAGAQRFVAVGVDGSAASSNALRWAADEARLRRTTLNLKVVHAWHVPTFGYGAYLGAAADGFEDWAKLARESLDEQVANVLGDDPGLPVVSEVVSGMAAEVVVEAAEGAELVVVGSRGRGGFSGLLLGSVSAQVAHHAPCPVTIVRPKV
jgi:nucleotide-binding universal stress UspA family protein